MPTRKGTQPVAHFNLDVLQDLRSMLHAGKLLVRPKQPKDHDYRLENFDNLIIYNGKRMISGIVLCKKEHGPSKKAKVTN